MDELLDRTMLNADYKKAARRMAEALLMISEPSWSHLGQDTKNILTDHLIAHYMEAEYEPRHAKE